MRLLRGLRHRLDTLLAPAEDPRQSPFGLLLERHQRALGVIRSALQEIEAMRAAISERIRELDPQLDSFRERARQELSEGRDELARVWLQRRRSVYVELERLKAHAGDLSGEQERLVSVEQRLLAHLESLQAREEELRARYSAAQAQSRAQQLLEEARAGLTALELPLADIEERADWMRARAQAFEELSRTTGEDNDYSDQIKDKEFERDFELLRDDVRGHREGS